jgi:hypothetical protein
MPAIQSACHSAPRRLLFIFLTGEVERAVSDGEVRRFGPGNGMLVEETSGKGHASRAVGNDHGIAVIMQGESKQCFPN